MEITRTAIEGVRLLQPRRLDDLRGYFIETFREQHLLNAGIETRFVQENQAFSRLAGTVRGLHFQRAPHAQAKLVRALRGAAYDVVVDLRRASSTYGRHLAVRLSSEAHNQIYVPRGCAHGYCTLEPNTELSYKVDDYWAPESEFGIQWNDPALGIDWPVAEAEATVSDKDKGYPRLAELPLSDIDSGGP